MRYVSKNSSAKQGGVGTKHLPRLLMLVAVVLLASCASGTSSEVGGPRIWIDSPINGDAFVDDIDTIIIYSHAAGDGGVSEVELYIDGDLYRVDASISSIDQLIAFEQPWQPPGPGEYLIEVRAKNVAGEAGPVAGILLIVGGEVVQVEDSLTPAQIANCPIPDANTLLHVNQANGFCFLYPNDHIDRSSDLQVPSIVSSIQGPPVPDDVAEGLTTSFSVNVEDALGKTTDQFVTDKIDQGKIPGDTPSTTQFTLDGEGATWTEDLGSQVGARSGFLVHNETGFSLTVIPNGGDFDDINIQAEDLWNTITLSWKWLDSVVPPTVEVTEEFGEEPIAIFETEANCRQGPSTAYGIVTSIVEGTAVSILGRNDVEPRWWNIQIPDSSSRCWVSDSIVDASGAIQDVVIVAAPPPPTITPTVTPMPPTATPTNTPIPPPPSAPSAPSNLTVNDVCNAGGLDVSLSWQNNSDNETGFRVYRNGLLQATLPAGTTNYNQGAPHTITAYTYAVEAYNGVGNSSQASAQSNICPVP